MWSPQKSKVIITLTGKDTSETFLRCAAIWNENHPRCQITCLRDHHGQAAWRGGSYNGGGRPTPAPEDFTVIFDGAEVHRTPELGDVLLRVISHMLHAQGYTRAMRSTRLWTVMSRTGSGNSPLFPVRMFPASSPLLYPFAL